MFSEFSASKESSRVLRAVMCLNSKNAPEGYFLAPAIKRCGIVICLDSNVKIKTNDQEFVPPQASCKGVFDIPYFYSYCKPTVNTFAADLHPTGLYEITKKEGGFFKNKYVDLRKIWPVEEINYLFSALADQNISLKKRAVFFDEFIQNKMGKELSEKSLIVEKADQMAKEAQYHLSINEIIDTLIISRKTLERAFKEVLGITPKQYFTSAIFEEMIRTFSLDQKNTVSEYLESPFYDLSHINKWYKKFTAMSPTNFAKHDMDAVKEVLMHHQ